MNKKFIALVGSAVLMGTALIGASCGGKKDSADLRIAFLSGGRGETYVNALVEEFKKTDEKYKDFNVDIISGGGSAIEDKVESSIKAGKVPDVIFMNFNMEKKLTNKFVSSKQLVNLDGLLDQKVYGEEILLKDKLIPGVLENYTTKPYGDSVYSLPAFYSPTGLWYDASRFGEGEGQYKMPTTWDEFFALGDKLNAAIETNGGKVDGAHPALFTYPTAGYFDGYIFSAIASVAGEEKFVDTLGYKDGIWEDADVKAALEKVVKLRDYLEPNTVAQANSEGFKSNQQAVIGSSDGETKGTALFMPNGDWIVGEMEKTTPKGFEWGFTALPKKVAEDKAYVNTFIENVYLHTDGKNTDAAKDFLLFYFSNAGAKIVAKESNAIIPTKDALTNAKANGIADTTINLYKVYDSNIAVNGSFAPTSAVTGVIWNNVIFNDLNDKVFNKDVKGTIDEILTAWCTRLEEASDKYREKILK